MSFFDWMRTLALPVLVVGNGALPTALNTEAFASVVRFNNYQLDERTGQKTTHWVTSGYLDIEARAQWPVALVPWTRAVRASRHCDSFSQRTGTKLVFTPHNNHFLKWFPHSTKIKGKHPSTGFCFVTLLLWHNLDFTLVGFDGMKTGHYWDSTHKHDHGRTKNAELKILLKQCKFYEQSIQIPVQHH